LTTGNPYADTGKKTDQHGTGQEIGQKTQAEYLGPVAENRQP